MKLLNRFCKKLISSLIEGKCPCLFGQCISPTVNGDDGKYQDMYTYTIPVDRNEKNLHFILAKLVYKFF